MFKNNKVTRFDVFPSMDSDAIYINADPDFIANAICSHQTDSIEIEYSTANMVTYIHYKDINKLLKKEGLFIEV